MQRVWKLTHGSVITTAVIASNASVSIYSPTADARSLLSYYFLINKILRSSGDESSQPRLPIIRLSRSCRWAISFLRQWQIKRCLAAEGWISIRRKYFPAKPSCISIPSFISASFSALPICFY